LQDTASQLIVVGRGKVIADASVAELISVTSGDRVVLRTSALPAAAAVLRQAGGTVTAAGPGTLAVTGLAAERVVALLASQAVPFAEVSAHRATLEEAYLHLTRDAVEFRAAAGQEAGR
ncbi:MAG: ABC transporter ATP-binding protein, partial [Actinomycetota bacterium]